MLIFTTCDRDNIKSNRAILGFLDSFESENRYLSEVSILFMCSKLTLTETCLLAYMSVK